MLEFFRNCTLIRRQDVSWQLSVQSFAGGLALGFTLAVTILLISGVSLSSIVSEFVVHVFADSAGLAQATIRAIPLVLVGLGAAAAIKLQFWNIGIEGQVWAGAIAATAIAFYDIGPDSTRLFIMLLAAFAGGAAWIALPVLLKIRYGVNEIIMTLLLTYVVFQIVEHLLFGAWQDPSASFPVSPRYEEFERLTRIGWETVHAGIWISLACVALMWLLMERSRFGYYATAVGENFLAAKATGIPVISTVVISVLLSGGLAGLAGGVIATGTEYRLTQFLGIGYTFSGIVIAFIARFRPVYVLVVAFVLGGIYSAGDTLKVFYSLSEAIVVLIEGTILLSVLSMEFFTRYRVRFGKAQAA